MDLDSQGVVLFYCRVLFVSHRNLLQVLGFVRAKKTIYVDELTSGDN